MNELNLDRMIIEAADAVLETMFFAEPLGPPSEPREDMGPVLQARVKFTGKPSGNLRVSLTVSGARFLAANFMGEDESTLTSDQMKQVVSELTNMLCGTLVSKVQSNEPFDLGSPELLAACHPPSSRSDLAVTAQQSFALEAGALTVTLCLEPTP